MSDQIVARDGPGISVVIQAFWEVLSKKRTKRNEFSGSPVNFLNHTKSEDLRWHVPRPTPFDLR
jgi:hypothetical protein